MQKEQIKINIIMPGLGDSGGIKVIQRYAEMMTASGEDVCVYCPIKAYNLHRYKSEIKNKIHQIYCTVKTLIACLKKEKKNVKWVWRINNESIRDADASIATMWATAFDVDELSKDKGKKFYFIQDFEIWDNRELALKSYKLPLEKIVISSWINIQLKNEMGIGPFPIVINGLDTNLFKDYGTRNDDELTFMMLNHYQKKKGVAQGLEVFNRIRKEYPKAKLIMFGMCDNSNLPSDVEYHQNPTRKELVELYNQAHFYIFPSLDEGWGLTPVEAMACGCVVFGTKTGFVLDLGQNMVNMMISEPGDVNGMVENIKFVIDNDHFEDIIRENAKKTISNLDWNKSLDKLLHLLEGH